MIIGYAGRTGQTEAMLHYLSKHVAFTISNHKLATEYYEVSVDNIVIGSGSLDEALAQAIVKIERDNAEKELANLRLDAERYRKLKKIWSGEIKYSRRAGDNFYWVYINNANPIINSWSNPEDLNKFLDGIKE